jgi:hypothetical protein
MPVPPIWFAAATVGLVGYFINPALYLIGAGAILVLTGIIASNGRFRRAVDAMNLPPPSDDRDLMRARLDGQSRERQEKLEQQCSELQRVLEAAKAGNEHIQGVWRLAELHMRLMVARTAAEAVLASRDGGPAKHLAELQKRLSKPDMDKELRETLQDQASIAEKRVTIQNEARRRIDVLDAELDRIREQLALVREQALMTSDPAAIRRSVDALSTFLSESGRWLQDQQEIFGELDLADPFGSANSGNWQRAQKRAGELQ